ncbi:hypothetical protein ACPPVU_08910 [Mucilaginibacter sp. McL0603]|uniref:hypothetical protein n=1 Tax=Mucilaginibacter sp. McL0603 TaxID=3415670 RepID=UPI003CE68706
MKKLILLTAVLCLTFVACQKNNAPQPETSPTSKSISPALAVSTDCLRRSRGTDVYITGIYQPASARPRAIYWKNGTIVNLAPNGLGSEAFGIAVKGNDVYITGDIIENNGERHPVYWKNGVMRQLYPGPATSFNSATYDITLDGNDVYIVGDYNDFVNNTQAMLWKNGVPQILGYNPYGSSARAVKVKGSDVYAAGYSGIDVMANDIAAYWKNGVVHQLENNQESGFAMGMALNGDDVYIAGETSPKPAYAATPRTAVYWKNGVRYNVQYNATAAAITISNNNIYIAGSILSDNNQDSQDTYWKNGVPTLVGDVEGGNFALDIQVAGNDVYLLTEKLSTAICYKNGVAGVTIPNVLGSRILVVHH